MDERLELEDRILRMLTSQYVGIYQIDIAARKVMCLHNEERALDMDEAIELDNWIQRMVDSCNCEDRKKLDGLISYEALEAFAESDKSILNNDVRLMDKKRYKWMLISLIHDTANDKDRNQITVTCRDVTHRYRYYDIIKRKNLELKKLLQTTEQYKDALMSEAIVLYQVDFSRDVIENDIFQKKKNKMLRVLDAVGINTPCSYDEYCRRWDKRVSEDTIDNYRKLATSAAMIEAYNNGSTLLTQDYRTLDSQNEEMWIGKTIYLAKDNITEHIIGIVSLRNVTERYHQEYLRQSLAKQASLDLLTGLYNHITGELLIKSKMDSEAYLDSAFIIFDIDKFKSANDTYGHYFGDCVLQQVAARLKECIREDHDIAIRYGGDEFVVYVQYKQEDNILDIVDRIFNKVSCVYDGYQVSISMGISLSSDGDMHYYDMYKNADKALYEAKRGGRCQYRFYRDCKAGKA